MKFQIIVIIIATILLILALTFMGYGLHNDMYNAQFPPVQSTCPDYWDISGSKCLSSKQNLGNKTCSVLDLTNVHYLGHAGNCNKSTFAKDCDITWDGITNNPNICTNPLST